MPHVAIFGLGLMGGSLGLALKRGQSGDWTVHGYTRSKARGQLALDRGAIDHLHEDPVDAVGMADVVVLCAPILAIPDQLKPLVSALKPEAVVTDVGSTKVVVQADCEALLAGSRAVFIGSHPIAGSEQQGMDAARDDLYDGSITVITPAEQAPVEAVQRVTELWVAAGSNICAMRPEEHDRILASTSHLPHVVAGLLAATVGRSGRRPDIGKFCGTGFRDTTRVAKGGAEIWRDILMTNRTAILEEMHVFRDNLDRFIEKLEQNQFADIEGLLEEAKATRQAMTNYGN